MKKVYVDTETCGLYGLIVLIQYAYDADGEIQLFEPWRRPVRETLALIEELCEHCIVGFNLSFDMFHLCKLYTIWSLLPEDFIPESDIELMAKMEPLGRDGPCVKPAAALDLLLHSRRGPYQCLMARDKIRVRKVPTVLAGPLACELEGRIEFEGIMFAGRADKDAPKWQVLDRRDSVTNAVDPDFKDVVLGFNPQGGLKYLAEHALGLTPFKTFTDVEPATRPRELGYVPFAYGISSPEKDWQVWDKAGKLKGVAWPALMQEHIDHWAHNEDARKYAWLDVHYTRLLDGHFDFPEVNDDDSVLACMVGAVRWHGFIVDTEKTAELLKNATEILEASPVNINAVAQVRDYIRETMDDSEATLLDASTKKANLEKIRDEMVVTEPDEICVKCFGEGCLRCGGKGTLDVGPMPASTRVAEILKIKSAGKEVELHSKLQQAGRFHASFSVIGTLSSRMSGADGLNAQGIKHSTEVRKMFPLAWDGMVLCGGDFDSFEVTLADAVFKDKNIRSDLIAGKKLHAIMGSELYPDKTYDDVIASDGDKVLDMYTRGKQAVFAMLYGGDHNTINNKLSIPLDLAEAAFTRFQARYPGIARSRAEVAEEFQALKQPEARGKVYWKDPKDYSETFLGFRRYFTLENKICKALFELAQNVPREWNACDLTIVRTDREQRVGGAVASALYGAAFQLVAGNIRAINNHLIQSPGAMITKNIQRRIWDLQPAGANDWVVAPMNVHDEIMCVTRPDHVDKVAEVVAEGVESYREQVPLIGMKWCLAMDNWAEKKGGKNAQIVYIQPDVSTDLLSALEESNAYADFGGAVDCEYDLDDVLESDLFDDSFTNVNAFGDD